MVWLLLIPLAVLAISLLLIRKRLQKEEDVNAKLRTENTMLAQYRDVVDAKAEAERILTEARIHSDETTLAATAALAEAQENVARLIQQAQQNSSEELSQARVEAKTLRLR